MTINSPHIARVVRQVQLLKQLDRELEQQRENMREITRLTSRVVSSDTRLSTLNSISF